MGHSIIKVKKNCQPFQIPFLIAVAVIFLLFYFWLTENLVIKPGSNLLLYLKAWIGGQRKVVGPISKGRGHLFVPSEALCVYV